MADEHRENSRRRWRLLLPPIRIVFAVIILVSEIVRPIYRPLVRWISSLPPIEHVSAFVGRLPRLAILVLFVVPFAIAEPLKIVGVVLITRGALVSGLVIIVGAYLMSFVLVERIFDAGREKLLTYGWLRWIMDRVEMVRSAIGEMKKKLVEGIRRWLRAVGR